MQSQWSGAWALLELSASVLEPLNAVQETIVTSTSQVVVVVIPGFPIESLAIGVLLGLALLVVGRMWKLKQQQSVSA